MTRISEVYGHERYGSGRRGRERKHWFSAVIPDEAEARDVPEIRCEGTRFPLLAEELGSGPEDLPETLRDLAERAAALEVEEAREEDERLGAVEVETEVRWVVEGAEYDADGYLLPNEAWQEVVRIPADEGMLPPVAGDRLQGIAERIAEEPGVFDQTAWPTDLTAPGCDTPACAGGHAAALYGNEKDLGSRDMAEYAAELLRLTPKEAETLFGPRWPRHWFAEGTGNAIPEEEREPDGKEAGAILEWLAGFERLPLRPRDEEGETAACGRTG